MNINPIEFNYVDGLNKYPIIDYINENITSNTSNITNYITSNNSNITNYITSNSYSCNITLNNGGKLDSNLFFSSNNLIICNSNAFGEIRFKTAYNYPNSNLLGTKIDYSGKLQVFHNYNILQPTFGEGYYDVEGELLGLKADGINTDAQLTILEAGALTLQGEINDLIASTNLLEGELKSLIENSYYADTFDSFKFLNQTSDFAQYQARYANTILNIQNNASRIYDTSFANGFAISAGFGLAGAGLASASSYISYQQASNAMIKNPNFSSNDKYNLYNNNTSNEIKSYSNFAYATSNLHIQSNFINSKITNQQLIPKVKSNEITLNNKAITKFSLDNLDDWIKTTNGIYYDITNGTLAINSTPTAIDFFRVGGQTTIQGDFICEKKLITNNTSLGLPTASTNGGIGDKLILRTGGTGLYPYSLGVNTNNMWYSSPTGSTHNFYINGSPITAISSTGLSTTGTINASTNLQENSVNLSSKYLQLSGGIMSGDLSFNNRVQDFLIYLFSTNYGFGVNSLALRYNVPFDASHKFYSGPTNTATISSTGAITASGFVGNGSLLTSIPFSAITSVPSYVLKAGDTMTGTLNGTTINASTNLQENAVNLSAKYLQLSGGTMTSQLILSTATGNNPLRIKSTITNANNSILILNDIDKTTYMGVGGSAFGGNYQNNFFIESSTGSIVLNTNGRTSASTPNFIINNSGNIGIATNNPVSKLTINDIVSDRWTYDHSTSPLTITNQTPTGTTLDDPQPILNICRQGVGAVSYGARATFKLCRYENSGVNSRTRMDIVLAHNRYDEEINVMTLKSNYNVGIGTTNPLNIFQIGQGGRLRIANDEGGYTYIGTNDVENNTTNTSILIQGKTGNYTGSPGSIFYFASVGNHSFWGNGNERMRISNDGKVGIGANNSSGLLTLSSPTQISARIILSGQEYYRAGFTSGDGLALFCGVNRDQNKQLWIGNSANLVQNSAKAFVRISAENEGYIDVTNGDGTGSKPFTIGGSSITLNTDTTINGTTTQNGDINVNNGNIVLANEGKAVYTPTLVCGGNTLYYVVNWNGTTHSGWFYDLNQHFYSGHAYLTIAIHAMNVAGSYAYCWFGRVLLSTFPNGTPPATNGGVISIITDYRNPASYVLNNNYISVVEVLDTSGHSALKISISNAVFGAQFKIKVVG